MLYLFHVCSTDNATTENIHVSDGLRRIVTFLITAPYKYSYLLTYLQNVPVLTVAAAFEKIEKLDYLFLKPKVKVTRYFRSVRSGTSAI